MYLKEDVPRYKFKDAKVSKYLSLSNNVVQVTFGK